MKYLLLLLALCPAIMGCKNVAFAACFPQTANANLKHETNMQEAESQVVAALGGVNITKQKADLFWSKVKIGAPDECWPWTGGRFGGRRKEYQRYGAFQIGSRTESRRTEYAHRISFVLKVGKIPASKIVRHAVCGNSICCNPKHLEVGSNLENYRDSVRMGTAFLGRTGEDHFRTKITASDVRDIRRLRDGGLTMPAIGKKFGLTRYTVWDILHARTWSHV